ncbi:phage tail protein [Oceanicola sp. S124]|uniref:phage tail protein n=1 Tax=Oceanicola sp. S124 TaxID=1042378 RepID=UPI00025581B5|nr:tail fiber protein [Oceanicola sp. S124]
MSEPFIAEIRIFAGDFAPRSWAFCDGQLLPIANNTALFSLIGTTYGGDGRSTTALPDLQGRAPMHPGRGPGLTTRTLGESLGSDTVTLTEAQLPPHDHMLLATAAIATTSEPTSDTGLARSSFGDNLYQSETQQDLVSLAEQTVETTGGGQAHENQQPYLGLNFIIALAGLYPSHG